MGRQKSKTKPAPPSNYPVRALDFDTPDTNAQFANELMFAKHSMKETELKMWLISLAALVKNQPINDSILYEFKLTELADKLKINKDTGWRNVLMEIIDKVSDKSLKILQRYSPEEDKSNWIKIPLYDYIGYNDYANIVQMSLNKKILPYLQGFTDTFTEIDIVEMIAIRGITHIRVFMLVKELMAENRYEIPIEQFKERLNIPTTSYTEFKALHRAILKTAEEQIRKHTSLKQFHFSHNGKGRKPATTLTLNIVYEKKQDPVKAPTKKKETLEDKILALDPERLHLFDALEYYGVTPRATCYKIVTDYSIEVLKSNLEYFKEKQKSRLDERKEPLNAGYLINCIKKDYAKPSRETLLHHADTRELQDKQILQTNIKLEAVYKQCKANATQVIKKGKLNKLQELLDLTSMSMQIMADNMDIPFDLEEYRLNLHKRDMRNKITLLFREQIAQRMMLGYVKMEDYI